jgi:hypothetical protein
MCRLIPASWQPTSRSALRLLGRALSGLSLGTSKKKSSVRVTAWTYAAEARIVIADESASALYVVCAGDDAEDS